MTIDIVHITSENLGDAPEWDSHPFSTLCAVAEAGTRQKRGAARDSEVPR